MTVSTPLQPGTISPRRAVPSDIVRPHYVDSRPGTKADFDDPMVKDADTIARMRVAGRIAGDALVEVGRHVAPGVTTDELDRIGHEFMIERGAYPSTLGYKDFPKSLCTSVNEVICHGIPDSRPLADGDVVKVDITAYIGGVHGDTCATFFAGTPRDEVRELGERTREAMLRGINAVRPGRPISVIGRVIESYAKRFGYGVVRDYTGHGVGPSFHTKPTILHYDEPRATTIMEPGMTFTVEPMLNLGTADWEMWDDGWTVVTADRKRSAQFEHTILVTEDGTEILTLP
jgi:methionyl aminopeptidase